MAGMNRTVYTFIKNTIPVVADELGAAGYNTAANDERNKGAFVMGADAADIILTSENIWQIYH